MFITTEGPDGSGKTTQAIKLAKELSKRGMTAFKTSFPQYRYSQSGPLIAEALNRDSKLDLPRDLIIPLMIADRVEARDPLRKAIKDFGAVISDRYAESHIAYTYAEMQGERDLPPDFFLRLVECLRFLEYEVLQLPRPDVALVIDIDAEESVKRTAERDIPDKNEVDLQLQKNVRKAYQKMAAVITSQPKIYIIDANGKDEDEVHEDVMKHLGKFWPALQP